MACPGGWRGRRARLTPAAQCGVATSTAAAWLLFANPVEAAETRARGKTAQGDRGDGAQPRACLPHPLSRARRRAVADDLSTMKLFTGNANVELAREIADQLGVKLGNITVRPQRRLLAAAPPRPMAHRPLRPGLAVR